MDLIELDFFSFGDGGCAELTEESLFNHPLFFKGVDLIGNEIASHNFTLFQIGYSKEGEELKTQVYDNKYLRCVNKEAGEGVSAFNFWKMWAANYFLYGAVLVYKQETQSTTYLKIVPFGTWREVEGGYSISGQIGVQKKKDYIIFVNPNYKGNPVKLGKVMKSELRTSTSIMQSIKSYFTRGHGPLALKFDSNTNVTDDKKTELRAKLKSEINESGILLMNKTAEVTELARSMKESETAIIHDNIVKNAAALMGIPASYFNIGTVTDADRKALYQNTIKPLIVSIEKTLNVQLLTDKTFSFESTIDINKADDIRKFFGSGGTPSLISINEGRKMLGLARKEGEEYDKISLGGYDQSKGKAVEPKNEEVSNF